MAAPVNYANYPAGDSLFADQAEAAAIADVVVALVNLTPEASARIVGKALALSLEAKQVSERQAKELVYAAQHTAKLTWFHRHPLHKKEVE